MVIRNFWSKKEPKVYQTALLDNQLEYIVQSGDTLWNISRKFNVTVSEIRKWNQLRRSAIQPGQKLIISGEKKSDSSAVKSAI